MIRKSLMKQHYFEKKNYININMEDIINADYMKIKV